MNINATLIGQSIAFIIFIWFCMKYVWPPIIKALEERKAKIAEGLTFAEQARKKMADAKTDAERCIMEAQKNATSIINQANKRASVLIEQAKSKAQEEAQRIKKSAEQEAAQEKKKLKHELQSKVGALAVEGACVILQKHLDEKENSKLVDNIVAKL